MLKQSYRRLNLNERCSETRSTGSYGTTCSGAPAQTRRSAEYRRRRMRTPIAAALVLISLSVMVGAQLPPRQKLQVQRDGFPSGHGSPEGAACDLARAFIQRDPLCEMSLDRSF